MSDGELQELALDLSAITDLERWFDDVLAWLDDEDHGLWSRDQVAELQRRFAAEWDRWRSELGAGQSDPPDARPSLRVEGP